MASGATRASQRLGPRRARVEQRAGGHRASPYAPCMSQRRIELQQSPDQAWTNLNRAAADVGKIEERSDTARFLVMKARYGLNPVRLRVAVLTGGTPESAVVEVQGRGQDVMGVASRKVIDKLVLSLQ